MEEIVTFLNIHKYLQAMFAKKNKPEDKEEKLSDGERVSEGQVLARVIIEMLGAPKEHIEATIRDYVKKLKEDEEIEIIKEEFSSAKEQGKFFAVFVELEIWFKEVPKLVEFCFDAMPSSVEIIEPTELRFEAGELSGLINDLQARIHQLDMIVKDLNAKLRLVDKNAMTVLENFAVNLLKDGGKTQEEMGKLIGMKPGTLTKFLEQYEKDGKIKKENDKYMLKN